MKASLLLSNYVTADQIKQSGAVTFTIKDTELVEFKNKDTSRIEKKLALLVHDDRRFLLNKESGTRLAPSPAFPRS